MLAAMLARVQPDLNRPIHLFIMLSNAPSGPGLEAQAAIKASVSRTPGLTVEIVVNEPLVPILAQVHAFLRPSREDGDSVAIREALSVGCPVWASDAVDRPADCTVFPLADHEQAIHSLKEFLATKCSLDPSRRGQNQDTDLSRFEEFVRSLIGKPLDS